MPGTFQIVEQSFNSISQEGDVLFPGSTFSTGDTDGLVNDTSQYSAVTPSLDIQDGYEADIFAMPLLAGQTYTFDIDQAAGGPDPIDTRLTIIDSRGRLVIANDDAFAFDPGSSSELDPLITLTVSQTGIYFIAVSQFNSYYVSTSPKPSDDNFVFTGGDFFDNFGHYRLVVSTPSLPPLVTFGNGDDVETFGNGDQRVDAGAGNDTLSLQGGNDIAEGGSGKDTLNGGDGDDQLRGGASADTINGGDNNDALIGDSGQDRLNGGSGSDDILGGDDNDVLKGEAGHDVLRGAYGRDVILGGRGNDFIQGGNDVDRMTGGGGADVFHFDFDGTYFESNDAEPDPGGFDEDWITDFSRTEGDQIDLSDVYGRTLTFVGGNAFTGDRQVRVVNASGGDQEIQVRLGGPLDMMEILVTPEDPLRARDFIL